MLTAIDLVILLKLVKFPAGHARAVLAMLGTLITIGLSYWLIASVEFGIGLGLYPIESASRMGPVLAWELTQRYAGWAEIIWASLSLIFALWWARR